MDALFHIVIAYVGGIILLKNLNVDFNLWVVFMLSVISLIVTDIDHFIDTEIPIFHNIFLLIIFPTIILLYLHSREKYNYFNYRLTLIVMFIGHLLTDMVEGMYGIPLFYPVSNRLYMIPEWLEIYLPLNHASWIVSRLGIALFLYFTLILSVPIIFKFFSSDFSKGT